MSATVPLHHVVDGPPDAPAVLLGPSLGTSLHLFDRLAADLAADQRVVRFDHRGHGGSPVPDGPYSVEQMAADVVALADRLGLERFGYLGLSLGGAVGQVLALDHPDRLSTLVLCSTAPVFADPGTWRDRAAQVRAEGLEPLVAPTSERWFTPRYRAEHPEGVEQVMAQFRGTAPEGYAGCCDALAAYDVTDRLGAIRTPTRVVMGAEDPGTTPEVGERLAAAVPGADLVVLADAAHILTVRPDDLAGVVRDHLAATAS